ncbi:oxygenase MpaB family protein [Gordonia sp. ABSL1-1]|uniref:oxygenase MpaB family protein n=1 Tax=Gordonia sp. ABSL1-1 TaxID=3053923 RepID=UPI0025725977|nr:oxygenase MpaB family protein [Gordonia sp. ABSL1-1]MDL9935627.1 oxygenase MpaB family protein [Gordonia sp. ABSL1-1]
MHGYTNSGDTNSGDINSGGLELGPQSLLWRFLGDRRYIAALCRAFPLQMLNPAIAAATMEFSLVPKRIFVHKSRTIRCLIESAYLTDFDSVRLIRYAHDTMSGQRPDGVRYHALNPEIFLFEHCTYVDAVFACVDAFHGGLDDDEREQLYQDTRAWYRIYGISARSLPATYRDFTAYFADALATQTDPEPGMGAYGHQFLSPDYGPFKKVPSGVVRALQHPLAQHHLGISPTDADRRALTRYGRRMSLAEKISPNRVIFPDSVREQVVAARSRAKNLSTTT